MQQGGAMAAITSRKLQQMRFAAEMYTINHSGVGARVLAVIAIDSDKRRLELVEVE